MGGNKMKKTMFAMLAGALVWALALSCAKTVEEEAPQEEPLPQKERVYTGLEAYIVADADADTRTGYNIDEPNLQAKFYWVDGDHIDAIVTKDALRSSVVFTKQTDTPEHTNYFLDGQLDGQPTLDEMAGYSLEDWAFYPSRMSPEAQDGGYAADWSYSAGSYKLDLPANVTPLSYNPLAVVPMVGKKDGEGKYAFSQMTGVFAVPVTNLPAEADYITIHSETAALAGLFTLTETANGMYVAARAATADVEKTLTLHFSGMEGDYTFYFSVPVGDLPAGLTLTIGSSTDEDIRMTRTTKKAINIPRGTIVRSPAMAFTPVDQQWQAYGTGTFIDKFIWGQHGWNSSITVGVIIERSGLHPNKFRMSNPYTVACSPSLFNYTPANGGTADDYLVFLVDGEDVSFYPFRTGIDDSAGRPMMITYRAAYGANTGIVRQRTDGKLLSLKFGGLYSDPDDPSHYYSRDQYYENNPPILVEVDDEELESWNSLGNCTFIDNFIWPYAGLSDPVECDIQQFSHDKNRFRIAKPYPAGDADEWFEFNVSNPDAVTSVNYYTGTTVADEADPNYTWKAVVYNGAYGYWYSNVMSTQPNGLPLEVQIGPCYRDSEGLFFSASESEFLFYEVGKDHVSRNIDIIFPHEEETWESLGIGRYTDEWIWSSNGFAPYDVEVEVWRSNLDANRYRVTNPYPVANTAFKRAAAPGGGDDYLYLQINPSDGVVSFGTLVTGMTRTKDSAVETNNSSVICNWVMADAAATASILSKSISNSTVVAGTPADPEKIALYAASYADGDPSYFYSNSLGTKYLWFPYVYNVGEDWTDFCEGCYQDGTYDTSINGSDAIGVVPVTIQQSSFNSNRFRIANPYRAHVDPSLLRSTYDDYLYFQIENGLVYWEPFRPGVAMNPTANPAYELGIYHPVNTNLNGWTSQGTDDFSRSSVMGYFADGSIKKIRLGAHYFDIAGPTPGYCYTRHGSAHDDANEAKRIVISFADFGKAIVTPYHKMLKKQFNNPVASLTLPSGGNLDRLVVKVSGVAPSKVSGLRLYDKLGWMDAGYVAPDENGVITIEGIAYPDYASDIDLNFWMEEDAVGASIKFQVQEVVVSGEQMVIEQDASFPHYFGVIMNNGGDTENVRGSAETVASFRIPALVTNPRTGTLIAAYDVRYADSGDLQGDIDVGFKRSIDGGKTWSPLALNMDMGEYGGFNQQNNGIGDPCLLVDDNTGDIYCFAVWTNGHYGDADHRSLAWAGTGFEIPDTPQFMMVKSTDDGITWSDPINITRQIKKYDWRMTFQGPGRGITMKDGTLVIPIQHQEGAEPSMHGLYPLNSGIAYSTDHGEHWTAHNYAHPFTSECAVAEVEEGVLMLSMRDETDSHYRRVYTTTDLGRTWTAHSSNGHVYEQSACEASLIHVDAADNCLGEDLLLMSNPQGTSGWRSCITIQASLDKGVTWTHRLVVDPGASLGYSCLTMIDENTVGILFESSWASMVFMAIPLTDIVH